MRKLFVHYSLFRLLSPVFSGVIVYLLILLLNNNISQLQEEFFGEELYFCIGLSYLIQEFSRLLLLLFQKTIVFKSTFKQLLFQVGISMILSIVLVSFSVKIYFDKVLGFSVTLDEVITFNSIFCVITLIYILLFLSHQYLYKINTEKLLQEKRIKENTEDDFKQFKKGINPDLLFESFETLLVLIHEDVEKTDDFIDHLATIYRYILSAKDKQLIASIEEIEASKELVKLFNYLPYRNIYLENTIEDKFLVVPGILLFLIEQIVKITIVSSNTMLELKLTENNSCWELEYLKNDKISEKFQEENFVEIKRVFSIYSQEKIEIKEVENTRKISIPKLQIKS